MIKCYEEKRAELMRATISFRVLFFVLVSLFFASSVFGVSYVNTLGSNQSLGNNGLLFLDNTNAKVGVGTTSPGFPLQLGISKGFNAIINQGSDGTIKYYLLGSFNDNNGGLKVSGILAGNALIQGRAVVDVTFFARDGFLAVGSVYGNISAADIVVYSNGTMRYVWLKTGAWALVNVDVSAVTSGTVLFDGSYVSTPNGTLIYTLSTDAGSTVRMTNNGNVGVGTTSPASVLDIMGGSSAKVHLNSTGAWAAFEAERAGVKMSIIATNGAGIVGTVSDHPLYLRVNGTEPVTILPSGNVGIGTNSPLGRLDIIEEPLSIGDRGPHGLILRKAGANTYNQVSSLTFTGRNTGDFADAAIRSITMNPSDGTAGLMFSTRGYRYGAYTGAELNWSPDLYIDSQGYVGVGTNSPSQKLVVQGGNFLVNSSDHTSLSVSSSGSNKFPMLVISNDAGMSAQMWKAGTAAGGYAGVNSMVIYNSENTPIAFYQNLSERMRIDSNGNVGIGTTSPGSKLEVAEGVVRASSTSGSSNGIFQAVGPAEGVPRIDFYETISNLTGALEFRNSNAPGAPNMLRLISYKANPVAFLTNGTERMRIDSYGNVGIGTSSPATKLQVAGVISHPDDAYTPFSTTEIKYAKLYEVTGPGSDKILKFKMVSAAGSESTVNVEFTIPSYAYWPGYSATPIKAKIVGQMLRSQPATFNEFYIVSNGSIPNMHLEIWVNMSGASGRIVRIQEYPGSEEVSLLSVSTTPPTDIIKTYKVDYASTVMDGGLNMIDGYVGIGTTSPDVKLEVAGAEPQLKLSWDGGNGGLYFSDANANGVFKNWRISTSITTGGMLSFTPSTAVGGTTFSTPALSILSDGSVGIGTVGPGYKLDVNGSARVSSNLLVDAINRLSGDMTISSDAYNLNFVADSDANSGGVIFTVGGAQKLQIAGSGEVSIASVSSDGTGKVVCIKSDGTLGTCTGVYNAGVCTCG